MGLQATPSSNGSSSPTSSHGAPGSTALPSPGPSLSDNRLIWC